MSDQRPPSIAVVGWFWTCAGAGKAIGMTAYLLALSRTEGFASLAETGLAHAPPWFAALTSALSRHLAVLAAGWGSLGLFVLAAGGCFLRRNAWARLALEAVCWFGLVEAPVVAAFLYGFLSMAPQSSLRAADRLESLVILGIWICTFWFLVDTVSLMALRSRAIRAWFGASRAESRKEDA
jgi:hypothetical protein